MSLNKEWFGTKDAAYYIGRTVNAVHLLRRKGLIKAHKTRDGKLAFKKSELDDFLSGK